MDLFFSRQRHSTILVQFLPTDYGIRGGVETRDGLDRTGPDRTGLGAMRHLCYIGLPLVYNGKLEKYEYHNVSLDILG